MAFKLDDKLVIGVSSRALFDLSEENRIFETQGVEAYCRYQVEHEQDVLKPGPGFELIRALLELNRLCTDHDPIEVIIMSRNSPDTSLRVFNAIAYYGLQITRAALVSGGALAPYLSAFHTDLFLSAYEDDVQYAIDNGIAAGIICTDHFPKKRESGTISILPYLSGGENNFDLNSTSSGLGEIRIAFDADAVLFTGESEKIFQTMGLKAFEENEKTNAASPLAEGPFAKFLKKLFELKKEIGYNQCPIRTALVTARSAPAHERVIRTLRSWDVRVDEAFFLGGMDKKEVLKAFGAQIFFDDQSLHTASAAQEVPAARVPWPSGQKENSKIG